MGLDSSHSTILNDMISLTRLPMRQSLAVFRFIRQSHRETQGETY